MSDVDLNQEIGVIRSELTDNDKRAIERFLWKKVIWFFALVGAVSGLLGYIFGSFIQMKNLENATGLVLKSAAEIGEQRGKVDALLTTITSKNFNLDEFTSTVDELNTLTESYTGKSGLADSVTKMLAAVDNQTINGWPAAIKCMRKEPGEDGPITSAMYWMLHPEYIGTVTYHRPDHPNFYITFDSETRKVTDDGHSQVLRTCTDGKDDGENKSQIIDTLDDIIERGDGYGLIQLTSRVKK